MDKATVNKFKKLLENEKKKVLLQLSFDKDQVHDLEKKETGDIVDLAFAMYEKDRAIKMSEAEKKTLKAIGNALQRIENGVYGKCIHCQKEVDKARLEALPWATSCVDPKKCENNQKKNSKKS